MSGQTLVQGMDLATGRPVITPHKRTTAARAGAAITVGVPVHVSTATPIGCLVIAATSTFDHNILGIYEGIGGSGAVVTNVTNINGMMAAVTNDQIEVLLEGPTYVRGRMAATNTLTLSTTFAYFAMGCATVDGVYEVIAAPAAGLVARVVLHGTGTNTNVTTTEASAILAYVNP